MSNYYVDRCKQWVLQIDGILSYVYTKKRTAFFFCSKEENEIKVEQVREKYRDKKVFNSDVRCVPVFFFFFWLPHSTPDCPTRCIFFIGQLIVPEKLNLVFY